MTNKMLKSIHPGEILEEEFLKPMGISQSKLARDIQVPHRRVNEIIRGKRNVSPDSAMRLSRYFGTSAEFWLNLQTTYDLRILQREKEYSDIPEAPHTA
ncbi:MAG: addiction module antidote protein, HigA family [Deltaproteobacteria bacterium RIFCSPLOWO2_01_44_7]|nr:MAG: addiction module antidote protein, HigA family [Deltaproteobacteria bacterium RIFCSPHIGHO2_01_FULL_43_49]OGQ16207.1 MAG: addiction module antidote protein, HigA family [Deltaproteobacteria bacterium RIFCSPHIGHO2_02_FULL_44_53]OGQ29167.1 MAG: addiction module antidote protein, HigA family [Deltaproteobacteria bacterium RIFCSPHIGHO2_12_FULL_44_21]OGQ32724.1 MAG: addiction module antidote protein, HigA family [Deltaproteobacteria bacterium RIFCSPLOWO2_01_FULL_45_74]OGQ41826.1 MAG: addictio